MKNVNRIELFDSAKGFFILCVVIAHTTIDINAFNNNQILYNLWQIIGTFGVGGFYIISGYFNYQSKKLTLKRITKIIVPWLISSILTFIALIIFNNDSFRITDFFLFFIGYKSFYYFLTILIILEALLWLIPNKFNLYIPIVSLLSILFTQLKFIPHLDCVYLNPFNWILFYWFGQYIHIKGYKFEKVKNYIFIITMFLLIFCIIVESIVYFTVQNTVLEICITILVLRYFKIKRSLIMQKIGNLSFTIYLYHIPIISLLNRVMYEELLILQIFKPIITIIILVVLIEFLIIITNRILSKKHQVILKFILGLNF